MDLYLLSLCLLTFTIHLVGTLAYAVRIAGTRTAQVALALSLFNMMALVSRMANTLLAPLLAKRIEMRLDSTEMFASQLELELRWLLVSAALASFTGALMVPTCQRLFTRAVKRLGKKRNVLSLFVDAFKPIHWSLWRESVRQPSPHHLYRFTRKPEVLPWSILVMNTVATALWTVGVLAALYAGALHPELRVTASQLSSVINGLATVALFLLVDPRIAWLTDDTARGELSQANFRHVIMWLLASRFVGTLIAQLLLTLAADVVVWVALVI